MPLRHRCPICGRCPGNAGVLRVFSALTGLAAFPLSPLFGPLVRFLVQARTSGAWSGGGPEKKKDARPTLRFWSAPAVSLSDRLQNPMPRSEPNQTTPGFRCLILEDEMNVAALFAQAVNSGGGHATVAGTIADAGSLVAAQDFDVFVLDHKLPDGKGSDFFAWLREQGVPAPCIMLTGAPEIQLAVELTRNGLFEYLTKPVDLGHLLNCLRRAVAHAGTESNLQ